MDPLIRGLLFVLELVHSWLVMVRTECGAILRVVFLISIPFNG